ncbi:SigE family RNA polymerase sigma factor [Kitasatospora sp. NPDC001603]|uniref:SigE family RNA polymerase sigma factor n=1 Tax=Kitasatospora sp. NPDC001603 TaxID=3154388 RepID=UPI00332B1DF7
MSHQQTNEEPTFEEFVTFRGDRLHRIAWFLTGDVHLAEDLVQTVLVRVWPKWNRVKGNNPEAYVRRALINTHATWWRRRWRGETPTKDLPDTITSPDVFGDIDLEHDLASALRMLPPRQRAVVVLRFFEDLSVEETADVLNCHPGTVKSQTSKALRNLRRHLSEPESICIGERV